MDRARQRFGMTSYGHPTLKPRTRRLADIGRIRGALPEIPDSSHRILPLSSSSPFPPLPPPPPRPEWNLGRFASRLRVSS